MNISAALIDQLLHEEESTSVDFKRKQYKFEGATKEEKSEILKDILAFANAFRRTDAFILLGVEEVRGGKCKVVGVDLQLDDAKLQQFINSKAQRPITFSYREATYEGRDIGIVHIPIQSRPIYAKFDYGKVQRGIVYLRRGSSTDVATPEEVVQMGAPDGNLSVQPSLELNLIDRSTGKQFGESVSVDRCTWYEVPSKENIPKYRTGASFKLGGTDFWIPGSPVNEEFLRDVAAYVRTNSCFPISLEIRNKGASVIQDANFSIEMGDPEWRYEFLGTDEIADRPSPDYLSPLLRNRSIGMRHDVIVHREGDNWKISCNFGKVQPGATVRLRDDIFIGAKISGELSLTGIVYADNFSNPITVQFKLDFKKGSQAVTVQEIEKLAETFT